MVYIGNSLMDSDDGIYLTVDSLVEINNIITASSNITLRKVNVKPIYIHFMIEMVKCVRYYLLMMI